MGGTPPPSSAGARPRRLTGRRSSWGPDLPTRRGTPPWCRQCSLLQAAAAAGSLDTQAVGWGPQTPAELLPLRCRILFALGLVEVRRSGRGHPAVGLERAHYRAGRTHRRPFLSTGLRVILLLPLSYVATALAVCGWCHAMTRRVYLVR